MRAKILIWAVCLSVAAAHYAAGNEQIRASVAGALHLSANAPEGSSVWVRPGDSALIQLDESARFFRGVEVRISAPMSWLAHHGSITVKAHADLDAVPRLGASDLSGRRIASEILPGRIQTVYQIPVRQAHGLRTTPYSSVFSGATLPGSFPILFSLEPVAQNISMELDGMAFLVSARPILSDEGAVRIGVSYPEPLRGRPFTVLVNDMVVENLNEELVLREGEHHLAVVSEDFRNESRRFVVERARTVNLTIALQDPTPMIFFEAPMNAQIFLNNSPIFRGSNPVPVEPGVHEARFQIGDHVVTRTITVQRGRTYRIALTLDIDIEESN